jgi:hypothetical protein
LDPARWQEVFEGLMSRITGRFTRIEPRRRVRQLVLGLLSDLACKNCGTIAEWAGERRPDGVRHLLGRANSRRISNPAKIPPPIYRLAIRK